MANNKSNFLFLIGFISVIAIFVGFSFSSVESSYTTDNEYCKTYADTLTAFHKSEIDYVELLDDKLNSFTSKIDYRAKRSRFNGVVLVAYKNQILFEKAYGYRDPIKKEKLIIHSSFELASVSKQFTAASVLKLEEMGKVDLDQSLSTYFPDFKFKNIRIQDLLKHSTGLWDYMYLTEAYWEKTDAPNNQDVISLVNAHQSRLNFTPGRRFDYNNTNYAILVALVEKLSNQSFETFLRENFFDPYCVEETYVGVESRKEDNVLNAFQPYRRGFLALPPSFHNGPLGDKGIHTTAKSLWLWFKALKNHESLTEESVNKMFNLDNYKHYKYGMGFRTKRDYKGNLEVYHNGIWDGFRTGLHYSPNDNLTYIVLSHTQNKGKRYFQNYLKKQARILVNSLNINNSQASLTQN